MSPTYVSALVSVLAVLLPQLGVQIESEQLTSFISAVVVVISGLVIMYRRFKVGNITILGGTKA